MLFNLDSINHFCYCCSKEDETMIFDLTKKTKKEFLQVFAVTLVSFAINVAVAGAIVNLIGPQFNLDKDTWGSVAAMGGIIIAFACNFIGYKFIVFKK
jgi:putative flippase GtrA